MNLQTIYVEGNGMSSVYTCGALQYMQDADLLNKVSNIYCYSFGALIVCCFCCTGRFDTIIEFLQMPFIRKRCRMLEKLVPVAVAFPYFRKLASALLRTCISKFIPESASKLSDLENLSGKRIHILVCSVNSRTTKVFNSARHGEVDLLDVLLATCAIPFVFDPVTIGTESFYDGGTYSGIPHIRRKIRGESLLISSRKGIALGHGYNCYEQMWTVLLDIQVKRMLNRERQMHHLIMPISSGLRLSSSLEQLKYMFFLGARIACLEMTVHGAKHMEIQGARMKCCDMPIGLVWFPSPVTIAQFELMKSLDSINIKIVHVRVDTCDESCVCGNSSVYWPDKRLKV